MTIIVQAWIKRGQKTMFPQQVCPSLQSVLDLMVILANFKHLDPTRILVTELMWIHWYLKPHTVQKSNKNFLDIT